MKKNKIVSLLNAALACAIVAGCSKSRNPTSGTAPISTDSTAPIEMKVKWQVGKHYDEELTTTQTLHLELPNNPKPIEQDTSLTEDFTISGQKDLPDGGLELGLEITGFKIQTKQNDKVNLDFDSSHDSSTDDHNQVNAVLRKIVGAHLTFDLDSAGKVSQVQGVDEFIAQLGGKNNPTAQQLAKSIVNVDTLKRMVMVNEGLPPNAVKVGDQWPLHIDVDTGQAGKLGVDVQCKFTGWQDHRGKKLALVENTGTLASQAGSSGSVNGVQVSIEKGTTEGSSWYDPDKALIVDSASIQDMTVMIVMNGKATHNQMKQDVELKLIDVDENAK